MRCHGERGCKAAAESAPARYFGSGLKRANRRLDYPFGGDLRGSEVIVVLACVLALSSADSATVGASAIALRHALKIDNTDIGLLVAVSSLVAAFFSLPFGVLADRVQRTPDAGHGHRDLGGGDDMERDGQHVRGLAGGPPGSGGGNGRRRTGGGFARGRLVQRPRTGQIYSYILTGELVGAGVGFVVTGDISSFSWRAAFLSPVVARVRARLVRLAPTRTTTRYRRRALAGPGDPARAARSTRKRKKKEPARQDGRSAAGAGPGHPARPAPARNGRPANGVFRRHPLRPRRPYQRGADRVRGMRLLFPRRGANISPRVRERPVPDQPGGSEPPPARPGGRGRGRHTRWRAVGDLLLHQRPHKWPGARGRRRRLASVVLLSSRRC